LIVFSEDSGVLSDGLGDFSVSLGVLSNGLGVLSNGLGVLSNGLGVLSNGLGVLRNGLPVLSKFYPFLASFTLPSKGVQRVAKKKRHRKGVALGATEHELLLRGALLLRFRMFTDILARVAPLPLVVAPEYILAHATYFVHGLLEIGVGLVAGYPQLAVVHALAVAKHSPRFQPWV